MATFDTGRRRLLLAGALAAAGLFVGRSLAVPKYSKAPPRPKKVFAHYMVCCPVKGGAVTVEDLKNEIREAQARGLDKRRRAASMASRSTAAAGTRAAGRNTSRAA